MSSTTEMEPQLYSGNLLGNINPKKFQSDFLWSDARYPAFIAAWGTGKTMFGILRGIACTDKVPGNLGLIIRKEFTDLRDSTIKDFERYTGKTVGSNKDVTYPNGSQIMFRHGNEIDVLKNINLGWFMIEQAEEFPTDDTFAFLKGRLRRSGVPFHTGFVIGNTAGHNWIWRLWKLAPMSSEYTLSEATTFDNSDNLPQDYIEDLKRMETEFPHHYQQYVMNSWEDLENYKSVIQHDWCVFASTQYKPAILEGKRFGSCDPAFYGDDECVCDIWEDRKMVNQYTLRKLDAIEIAGRLLLWAKEHQLEFWAIESDGRGQDVVDAFNRLASGTGIRGIGVQMGSKPTVETKELQFVNLRAQIWWEAGKALHDGRAGIINDPTLIEQLCSVEYTFKHLTAKIQIEPKEETKERLGRSPDRADSCVLGIYAYRFARKTFLGTSGGYEIQKQASFERELEGVSTAGY